VGGADHDHNTEHEDRVGLVGSGMGSTEQEGEVVGGEVADENPIVAGVPVPRMEGLGEGVDPRRPLGVVHDHSQFDWSHRSVSIEPLR